MIQATNINEVIAHLDGIIEWSKQHQSRIGYFATLYRRMTIAVKEGILNNRFENAERMELLDVIFANRYLQAWEAYINKQKCTNAWCATFDACNSTDLIVLQHIILGVNTHINLDLGIAAAEACPGEKIYDLEEDFNKMNNVIASLIDDVQETLCNVWFPLQALTRIANHRQDGILNFSIEKARRVSWANAVALAVMNGPGRDNHINLMDNTVVEIAERIINPGIAMRFILERVLLMENKNIDEIIDLLKK